MEAFLPVSNESFNEKPASSESIETQNRHLFLKSLGSDRAQRSWRQSAEAHGPLLPQMPAPVG